jgi:hypothetical protein
VSWQAFVTVMGYKTKTRYQKLIFFFFFKKKKTCVKTRRFMVVSYLVIHKSWILVGDLN